jgi:hypothetical protein
VAVAAGTVLLVAPLLASCAPPVVFAATSTTDAPDAAVGDGRCETAAGQCSLRAAVQEAGTHPEEVEIQLVPGAEYVLTVAGVAEDAGASGDLDSVGGGLRVVGNGAEIDARSIDRVWDHHAGRLVLDDLVITGGAVPSGGGGIRSAASLVLLDVQVRGNTTTATSDPRGIAIEQLGGSLVLGRTEVVDNTESRASSGQSAGIYQAAGSLVLVASRVRANYSTVDTSFTGPGRNAGILQESGEAVLVASEVTDHHLESTFCVPRPPGCTPLPITIRGDGIHAAGSVEVRHSLVGANTTDLSGTGPLTVGASQVGRCSVAGAASLGYNRYDTLACTTHPTDSGAFATTVDQIPVGTAGHCDATTFPDIDGVPRPQGAACDIGPTEQ